MDKKRRFLITASITFSLFIFDSCRSAKYLDDDQYLVTKIDNTGIPNELKEQSYQYISNEIRPNSALNLTIYNIFNTKNGSYKNDKIRQVGEAPHILDSSLVDLSALQIQRFLQTKGYFNAKVTPAYSTRGKKSKIDFRTDIGTGFLINEIKREFQDSSIRSIYTQQIIPSSSVQKGHQYDAEKLVLEREKLYAEVRNRGYFDFLRQYMRVAVDTNVVNKKANLHIKILNPENDIHRTYKINNVALHIENEHQESTANVFKNEKLKIDYLDETGKYSLKPIARYMYLKSGDLYSQRNENLSYDRLYEMNGFRSVKINYEKVDSNLLNVTYDLVPRALMSNQIEGEYTFSSGMSGFNIGNTFSHRNMFGGSETLELKMRYGVLFDPRLDGKLSDKIFNNDFQVGVNVIVPRLLVPFNANSTGQYGLPRTTFSSSLQIFNQDQTYSNTYLINTLNYVWWQSPYLQHSYTPLVLEYRDGKFDPNFESSLINEGYSLYVESNNRQYFGLGSQYALTYNAPKLQKLEDFNFFRGSVDISGNTLGLLSSVLNFEKNSSGKNTLFGVTYLQYIKGEVDYRLYRHLGGNRQFIFRFNGGVALPYGNNSKLLIFEKSFFAGGMNGIRAWQARTLGPGNYNRSTMPEYLRLNLRNLDQLGEVKLESNFEYRFRILNNFFGSKMNGATFVDMGNIWSIRENEVNKQEGVFQFNKFFSQIAIGTGFGLRFDMDYFTMRLDAGLKIKDPQFTGKDQFVPRHWFDSKVFKNEYYQSHKPDRYNFVQYNFGVGLPF